MPVGAYGGRADLMRQIAPSGPIYQAGTLSGNPVAMAAGLAMLELIQAPGFHAVLEAKTHALCDGLEAAARDAGVAFTTTASARCSACSSAPSRWTRTRRPIACDTAAFNRFFHAMLDRGVYLAPVRVRSRLRVQRARRGDHRADHRRSPRCVRGLVSASAAMTATSPTLVLFDLDGVLVEYDRPRRCNISVTRWDATADHVHEALFGSGLEERLRPRACCPPTRTSTNSAATSIAAWTAQLVRRAPGRR
jgi:hypothetical protein